MKYVSIGKFELMARDFTRLGCEIETLLEALKEYEYGFYDLTNSELIIQTAWKIVAGMNDWQEQNNIGIRTNGDFKVSVEVFDFAKWQDEIGNDINYLFVRD